MKSGFLFLFIVFFFDVSAQSGFLTPEQRESFIAPLYKKNEVIPKRCQFLAKQRSWTTDATKGWDASSLTSSAFDRVVMGTGVGWDSHRTERVYNLDKIRTDFSEAKTILNNTHCEYTNDHPTQELLDARILACNDQDILSYKSLSPEQIKAKYSNSALFRGACIQEASPYIYADIIDRLDGEYVECNKTVKTMSNPKFNWAQFDMLKYSKKCAEEIPKGLMYAESFRKDIQTIRSQLDPEARALLDRAMIVQSKFDDVTKMAEKAKSLYQSHLVKEESYKKYLDCDKDNQNSSCSPKPNSEILKTINPLLETIKGTVIAETMGKLNQAGMDNALALMWGLAYSTGKLNPSDPSAKQNAINEVCKNLVNLCLDTSFKDSVTKAYDHYKEMIGSYKPINFTQDKNEKGKSYLDEFNESVKKFNSYCPQFSSQVMGVKISLEKAKNSMAQTDTAIPYGASQELIASTAQNKSKNYTEAVFREKEGVPQDGEVEKNLKIKELEENPILKLANLDSFRSDVGLGGKDMYRSPIDTCKAGVPLKELSVADLGKYYGEYKGKIDGALKSSFDEFAQTAGKKPNEFIRMAKPDLVGVITGTFGLVAAGPIGMAASVKASHRNLTLNATDINKLSIQKYIKAYPGAIPMLIDQEVKKTGKVPELLIQVLCESKSDMESKNKFDKNFDAVTSLGLGVCALVGGIVTAPAGGWGAAPCATASGLYTQARFMEEKADMNELSQKIEESFYSGNYGSLESYLSEKESLMGEKEKINEGMVKNAILTAISVLPATQLGKVGNFIKGSKALSSIRLALPAMGAGYIFAKEPDWLTFSSLFLSAGNGLRVAKMGGEATTLSMLFKALEKRSALFVGSIEKNAELAKKIESPAIQGFAKTMFINYKKLHESEAEDDKMTVSLLQDFTRFNDFVDRVKGLYNNNTDEVAVTKTVNQLIAKVKENPELLDKFNAQFATISTLSKDAVVKFLEKSK